jgi:hypothetical protein
MMRFCVSLVIAAALVPLAACPSEQGGPSPQNPPLVDAAPAPDAQPQPQPVTACEAAAEDIDLDVADKAERGSFYASAYYFVTPTGVHRKRLGGTTQTLIREGQTYPRLGEAATIHRANNRFEFRPPGGGLDCGQTVQIPLLLTYRTNQPGRFGGDLVVLVDDLTQELTHVLASGDTYDGEVVQKVFIASGYGACGRMVLHVGLASGRTLLVLADPPQQLRTLLRIAEEGGFGGGQPIEGAPDRFLGFLSRGSLEQEELTFLMSVDNAAEQRLGMFLGSLDLSSNKITCRITDTDIPCATRRPDFTASQNPWAWDQAGDTAAATDSVITVVRGDSIAHEIDPGFGVLVCQDTGDVFFPRPFRLTESGFGVFEVYALRRSGVIERVTRNLELDLAGSPRATNFDGFALTSKCDLIQGVRTASGEGKRAIYWTDGVFAVMSIDSSYLVAGYEGASTIPTLNHEGNAVLIRQPSGDCRVPADVFPPPAK